MKRNFYKYNCEKLTMKKKEINEIRIQVGEERLPTCFKGEEVMFLERPSQEVFVCVYVLLFTETLTIWPVFSLLFSSFSARGAWDDCFCSGLLSWLFSPPAASQFPLRAWRREDNYISNDVQTLPHKCDLYLCDALLNINTDYGRWKEERFLYIFYLGYRVWGFLFQP